MEESKYESQFMQLVMGLQGSAWMLLGKIANPVTGNQEKNLDGAKTTIDTLLMLKEKTKGNISQAEQSLLDGAIQQLQVNYMEEVNKQEKEEVADKKEKEPVAKEKPQKDTKKEDEKK